MQFQQSRLSSLSEAAMAPSNPVMKFVQTHSNLGAIILQQFVADMSKTRDFNKEEHRTNQSVYKKLQEEHEIRRLDISVQER